MGKNFVVFDCKHSLACKQTLQKLPMEDKHILATHDRRPLLFVSHPYILN